MKHVGRINAVDKTWKQWQRRTGEMPPDFSAMPSQPFLPDPLEGVRTASDWARRRVKIRREVEYWMTGRMPPAPDNLLAVVTEEHREDKVTVRNACLEFGPAHQAKLRLQLFIPAGPGPFPVFLTNQNRSTGWTAAAVARRYIGCIYHATDPKYGEEDDSDAFVDIYAEYDFACLARWAWAASRAVDYLLRLPEIDRGKLAICGHSRNGKQAVLAAAFDERIAAVISSSGNTGEGNPWRFASEPYGNESLEEITAKFPHWFHPRLRFFVGHEDKLPFDQNSLLALIAPRALLITSAYTEAQGCLLGLEQNFRSLLTVYEFLGAPREKLGLRLRTGDHPTTAGDIEMFVDFLDGVFHRKPFATPQTMIFGYAFNEWKELSGQRVPSMPHGDKLRWALGEEPPQLTIARQNRSPAQIRIDDGWIRLINPIPINANIRVVPVPFGAGLKADLFLPADAKARLPLVIWLHPYAYSLGYNQGNTQKVIQNLADRGYAVLGFDHIGFGTRVEQANDFYRRYPGWSLLGKMVTDTRAAITAATNNDVIDAARIYLLGYALGGKVALWTAALDSRPAAVISVAGMTPWRTSANTGAVYADSHLYGLLPRLGFFVDHPADVPIEYDDILRAIGNRRVLVVAPAHDRFANLDAIRQLVQPFSNVDLETPNDFNRFSTRIQKLVFAWLEHRATTSSTGAVTGRMKDSPF